MPTKDHEKNKAYVAKHRNHLREQMGEEAYRKKEADERRLRRQKKAKEANTLPPLDLNALKNYTSLPSMDINHLINLLPPPPAPKQQKKRGPKPKPIEGATENMTAKERRRIYIRNYMRNYRKEQQ